MAKGQELFNLMKLAESQEVTMSDLTRRSNLVRASKKRKSEKLKKRFKDIQDTGRDWWNN